MINYIILQSIILKVNECKTLEVKWHKWCETSCVWWQGFVVVWWRRTVVECHNVYYEYTCIGMLVGDRMKKGLDSDKIYIIL